MGNTRDRFSTNLATKNSLLKTALAFLIAVLAACCVALPAWAGEGLTVGIQTDDPQDRNFAGDTVKVKNVSAGTVSYDESTKTLTLDNVTMYGIYVEGCPDLTINLVGTNTLGTDQYGDTGTYFLYDETPNGEKCNVVITGSGSATGAMKCGDLTVNGGSLSIVGQSYDGAINCGTYTQTGGSVEIKRSENSSYGTAISSSGDFTVSGGVFKTAGSVSCSGFLSMRTGEIAGGVSSCQGALIAGASISGGLSCYVQDSQSYENRYYDLELTSGSVSGTLQCRNLRISGGTITVQDDDYWSAKLSCHGNMIVSGGAVDVKSYSYYSAVSVGGSVSVEAGSLAASGDISAQEDIAVTGGTFIANASEYNNSWSISCKNLSVESGVFTSNVDVSCDVFRMKTGAITGNVKCENFNLLGGTIAGGVSCDGNASISGGTVAGGVSCYGDASIASGTVTGGVSCGGNRYGDSFPGNLTISGGSVSGYLDCEGSGKLDVLGGTVKASKISCGTLNISAGSFSCDGNVSCNTFKMGTGSIAGSAECDTLSMSGGTIAKGVSCSGSASIAGGTVTGGISCGGYNNNGNRVAGSLTISGGTVKGRIECEEGGSFSVRGGSVKADGVNCGSFNVASGSFSSNGGVSCDAFNMKTGSISGRVECSSFNMSGGSISKTKGSNAVSCSGNFSMSGGSIVARDTESGISVGRWDTYKTLTMKMSGGSIKCIAPSDLGLELHSTNMKMSGGSITVSKSYGGGIRIQATTYRGKTYGGAFTMSKGVITATSPRTGISAQGSVSIRGGTIKVSSPSNEGISASGGNVTISGGTVSVTNSYGSGIEAYSTTSRGKTIGGKVSVTGGSVTATVRKPSQYSAISASTMTNKIKCLKSIKGSLPNGASFKAGGNEYKLGTKTSSSGAVLTKYGAKSVKPVFSTVQYGGYKYNVKGVGTKAFNTKQGKKVQSITFKNTAYTISADAFWGTTSLTDLKFAWMPWSETYKNGKLSSIKWWQEASIAKLAFRKCGKSNGAKLTIRIGDRGVYKDYASKYKQALVAKGLPKGAVLKTYK